MTKDLRQIRIEGNIAYVPLTRGYEAVIDAADVPLVDVGVWNAVISRNTLYAYRTDCSGAKRKTLQMHRVLMGEPKGLLVDHIDGDGLNNRRKNLRISTNTQNANNQRVAANNTSGFKGVSWHKRDERWQAMIRVNGKRKNLGYFTCKIAAAKAYDSAAIKYHKEFAKPNFPITNET